MILNLDEFEEELQEIQLGGKIYKIPSQIPTFLYFKIINVSGESVYEKIENGIKVLYEIFKLNHPDLDYEEFAMKFTVNHYTAVINFICAGMTVEETKKQLMEIQEKGDDSKKKLSLVDS